MEFITVGTKINMSVIRVTLWTFVAVDAFVHFDKWQNKTNKKQFCHDANAEKQTSNSQRCALQDYKGNTENVRFSLFCNKSLFFCEQPSLQHV